MSFGQKYFFSILGWRTIKRIRIIVILLTGFLIFCHHPKNIADLIQENDTKENIRQQIGNPSDITVLKKTTEIIWGPEEAFWSQLKLGEQVEVWSYQLGKDQLKLYFRENSDSLLYKTVVDPDAVYESGNQETMRQ